MASWMIHFRVAQAILDSGALGDCPDTVASAFALGNIAPDSGVPSPDGQGYTPNKQVSHFMRRFDGVPTGQNPERCDPHLFVREWFEPTRMRDDPEAAAFYLGYLCHLVTDNAWVRDFIYPAKVRFAHLRLTDGVETPEGVARFYAFLKKDWYDMDFLYLKHHPDLPAYRLFLKTPHIANRFLPFFSVDAFARKREEIADFYCRGVALAEERELYISAAEAEAFVARAARETAELFYGRLYDGFPAWCAPPAPLSI